MTPYVCLWYYLAEFFLEWGMFQAEGVQKIKPHILCSIHFFSPKIMQFIRQREIIWQTQTGQR